MEMLLLHRRIRQCQTIADIQNMLKAEIDEELGYAKNSQKTKGTGNRWIFTRAPI